MKKKFLFSFLLTGFVLAGCCNCKNVPLARQDRILLEKAYRACSSYKKDTETVLRQQQELKTMLWQCEAYTRAVLQSKDRILTAEKRVQDYTAKNHAISDKIAQMLLDVKQAAAEAQAAADRAEKSALKSERIFEKSLQK